MALNKDILGQNIYDALMAFNDKNPTAFGNLETGRLAFCKVLADQVIKHIKTAGEVPALGLIAPAGTSGGPVTGTAQIQ